MWLVIAGKAANNVTSFSKEMTSDPAASRAAAGGPVPVGGDDLVRQGADQGRYARRLGRDGSSAIQSRRYHSLRLEGLDVPS